MCVPEGILQDCKTMAAENTKSSAQIICIPARDRYNNKYIYVSVNYSYEVIVAVISWKNKRTKSPLF